MNRVVRFSRLRFLFITISILLIAGGIVGTVVQGGFNLGIDFQAGLNMRVQIAPQAFSVAYSGPGSAELNIAQNTLTVTVRNGETKRYSYPFGTYTTAGELVNALNRIDGLTVRFDQNFYAENKTDRLVGFNRPLPLSADPIWVNAVVASPDDIYAPISVVRTALSSLGAAQIQAVGSPEDQEYIIRVQDPGTDDQFHQTMTTKVENLLGQKFGKSQIIVKRSDYVGPRFSKALGSQVFYLTALALGLILIYVWFRFKLPYAVSSIVALFHDVSIMLGFIGTFQMEVSTATIAAVLTIVGYSLNDTIVIFDRVRENVGLLKENDYRIITDTSVTQSMSRTLITSGTTLLAVAAIYIFGAGSIKEFALMLIVGIVVGTYSSIFIASPILTGWMHTKIRRKKKRDAQKYGVKSPTSKGEDKAPAPASDGEENPKASSKETNIRSVPRQIERKERGKKRQKKKKK